MTKYFDITCTISLEGRIPLVYGERVRDVFRQVAGQTVQVIIQQPKRYSTNPQRQYYFGVIVTQFQQYFASHGQWIDKDELHDLMMKHIGQLWDERPDPFTETIDKRRRSYNSLSTTEAENYHTLCRAEAAKRGFDIPEPNEESAPRHIERMDNPVEIPPKEIEGPQKITGRGRAADGSLKYYYDNEEEIPK